jgi:hypothetical protein
MFLCNRRQSAPIAAGLFALEQALLILQDVRNSTYVV